MMAAVIQVDTPMVGDIVHHRVGGYGVITALVAGANDGSRELRVDVLGPHAHGAATTWTLDAVVVSRYAPGDRVRRVGEEQVDVVAQVVTGDQGVLVSLTSAPSGLLAAVHLRPDQPASASSPESTGIGSGQNRGRGGPDAPGRSASPQGPMVTTLVGSVAASPQTAPPPLPPGPLGPQLSQVRFSGDFHHNQELALDAFERSRAEGRRNFYMVMPPGSGKTVLGLEIARRLGNRTLCLGPNSAIQEQWIKQWQLFAPALIPAGDDPTLGSPFTALTYQMVCNLDTDRNPVAMDGDVDDAERRVARHRAHLDTIRSGVHDELLGLLHDNGRRIIEELGSGGPWTLVFDECHHLLEMWGELLRAVVREIGSQSVLVGLTATPPSDLEPREAAVYRELFGRVDFQIPTPAVVREGKLAPYQELAYLTTPLPHESEYIKEEAVRFQEFLSAVTDLHLGTIPLLEWVDRRVAQRLDNKGNQLGWLGFEATEPALAQAAMRLYVSQRRTLPEGSRIREPYRQEPTADDWVALISDWCMGHLRHSQDNSDRRAWATVHTGLATVGYILTSQGIRTGMAPVDRVLALSSSKAVAALAILDAEARALGLQLRALLLCDYEVAGGELVAKLRGVLDPRAGSAALALSVLAQDSVAGSLDPVLMTGRTVACARRTAQPLIDSLVEQEPGLHNRLRQVPLISGDEERWDDVVTLASEDGGWTPRIYVPLVTRAFERGLTRCLIGTRGLLGEGWDAPCVNVLIDLSGATTLMSVTQMRGRSLRLDPALPAKVADNWDVVCIDETHPKGDADYLRFVRKHRNYFSVTSTGEIESGVSHVDSRLSPFYPPPATDFPALNMVMLERTAGRDVMRALWRIGDPYANIESETVRVGFGHRPGIPVAPGRLLVSRAAAASPPPRTWLIPAAAGGAVLAVGGTIAGLPLEGVPLGALVMGGGAGLAARRLRRFFVAEDLSDGTVEDVALALADAMHSTGLVDVGGEAVLLEPQPDGYVRCSLNTTVEAHARRFSDALDELLSPISDPAYVIPRSVVQPPHTDMRALLLYLRRGRSRAATTAYHAVPAALSSRQRLPRFTTAWNHYVSPGSALATSTPEGQAVVEVMRGEDPFAATTQIRTIWR